MMFFEYKSYNVVVMMKVFLRLSSLVFTIQFLFTNIGTAQIAVPDTVLIMDGFTDGLAGARTISFKDKVYFFAVYSQQVVFYETDGTPTGTKQIPFSARTGELPRVLGQTTNRVFFIGGMSYLSSFDGTTFTNLSNFVPSSTEGIVTYAFSDDKLYFTTRKDIVTGKYQVWESDGTNEGTKEIATDVDSKFLITRDGYVYYVKALSISFFQLEKFKDGAASHISYFNDKRPKVLGKTTDQIMFYTDTKMWRTDGTTAGTVELNSAPGSGNYFFGDRMVYSVGNTLLGTDGFAIQTFSSSFFPQGFITQLGNRLVFQNGFFDYTTGIVTNHAMPMGNLLPLVNDTYALYVTRDSVGRDYLSKFNFHDLSLEKIVSLGDGPSFIGDAGAIGDDIIFFTDERKVGAEPWRTDGTSSGTVFLKDINTTQSSSEIYDLRKINSKLWFLLGVQRGGQFNTFFNLYSYDPSAKTLTLEHPMPKDASNSIVFKNYLYFGQSTYLFRINLLTGEKKIVFESAEGYDIVTLKSAGEYLYINTETESYYHRTYVTSDGTTFDNLVIDNNIDFTLTGALETSDALFKLFQYGNRLDIWKINGPGAVSLFNSFTANATFNPILSTVGTDQLIVQVGYQPYYHWLVSETSVDPLQETFFNYTFQTVDNFIYASNEGKLSEFNPSTKQTRQLLTTDINHIVQVICKDQNNLFLLDNKILMKLDMNTLKTTVIDTTEIVRIQQVEKLDNNVFFSGTDSPATTGMLYVLDLESDNLIYLSRRLPGANEENFVLFNASIFFPYTGVLLEIPHANLITGFEEVSSFKSPRVYPNPANNFIAIHPSENFQSAAIYGLSGRKLVNIENGFQSDITNLASGLYIIRLQSTDGTIKTVKFVKK